MALLVEIEGAEHAIGRAALHDEDLAVFQYVVRTGTPGWERGFDLSGKCENAIELGAGQIVPGEFVQFHERVRLADPTGLAVVRPGAGSTVGMIREIDPHAAFVGRLREDLKDSAPAQTFIAGGLSRGDET